MSAAKHTPGPLFVGARESTAIVIGSPQGPVLYRGSPAEFSEGDARLFAAATELLEALRGLLDPATNEDSEWYRKARAAARAAIIKATGGAT